MKNKQIHLLRTSWAALLLLAYLFANTHLPFFHHQHHSHQVDEFVSHTVQVHEHDACHNYVFHGDALQNCPHPGHMHESDAECLTCKAFLPVKFIVEKNEIEVSPSVLVPIYTSLTSMRVVQTNIHGFFLRGPPQTV